jgi:two-component system, sensor histidine kinase
MAKKVSRTRRGTLRARTKGKSVRAMRGTADVRAIERVLAELAHDIRTPLTGILALSELLAASELDDRERQWVRTLKNNAEHLAALTTLVVDAAKTGAGDLVLRREPFDPRVVAQAAAASMAARAEAAGLACKTTIKAKMPARVVGDVVRLRAALENLIDNAVKFTERGDVGFEVTIEKRARDLLLVFSISDSGIGLTALEIKRLFRPFTQAHAGIARRFGGAGLGLSLVKRLARAMGGNLTVTSTPGRGSAFHLSVAVRPADSRGEVPAGRGTRSLSVLHVEDNPYGRVVMNTLLTGLGHRADFVASARSAVEAVKRSDYDLVLMDVSLGVHDGMEVMRRVRAMPGARGRVPIIGIAGHDDGAKTQAARAAGMNSYLIKPVSARALADAIAAVTRAVSAQIKRRDSQPG